MKKIQRGKGWTSKEERREGRKKEREKREKKGGKGAAMDVSMVDSPMDVHGEPNEEEKRRKKWGNSCLEKIQAKPHKR